MSCVVFFQAEDGIRVLVRSRGLGDVYKRQVDLVGGGRPDVGRLRIGVGHERDLVGRVERAIHALSLIHI